VLSYEFHVNLKKKKGKKKFCNFRVEHFSSMLFPKNMIMLLIYNIPSIQVLEDT